MPTGTPSINASRRPPTTRSIVMARSVPTCPPAISAHRARAVSIGPGKISGGSVRDSAPQTITAVTRESSLSMAGDLHHRACRQLNAGASRAAARHLAGLNQKSVFVDGQYLAISHDHPPIDHGIPDVAAARAVDQRLLRIEKRHEMGLPRLHRDEVG